MNLYLLTAVGILLPFLGTTFGASAVFFTKKGLSARTEEILLGFAAGVMLAASIWSLILPAIELSASMGAWRFIPACIGLCIGCGTLFFTERFLPKIESALPLLSGKKRTALLILAVTLHNIPEGMAVGVVFAALLESGGSVTLGGAMALSLGVALQNLPEGAIVSLPLAASGMKKAPAFFQGVLSGAVEPIGALLTLTLTGFFSPLLPYLLSFAAGAMLYVVTEELIPRSQESSDTHHATVSLILGFMIMMILDVAAG